MFLINILLVDDHALFSKSLEIALSDYSEIETFDSINDVSQLDNYIVSKKPDIILMDINLKNISSEDGLELAKQIVKETIGVGVNEKAVLRFYKTALSFTSISIFPW